MRSPRQSSDVVHEWMLGVTRGIHTLFDMGKITSGVGITALCVVMVVSAVSAGQQVASSAATATGSTVPVADVADAGDPAVRLGRVVPTTSTLVRTIGECVPVGLDVPNSWRAELGWKPLVWSESLYGSACAWATHLAEQGGMTLYHEPGPYGETLFMSITCAGMWDAWFYSPGHYAAWMGHFLGVTAAVVTVTDNTGQCWGVGRIDNQLAEQ